MDRTPSTTTSVVVTSTGSLGSAFVTVLERIRRALLCKLFRDVGAVTPTMRSWNQIVGFLTDWEGLQGGLVAQEP